MRDSQAASARPPSPTAGPVDPRDILAPAEADRLIDALARILLAAARVRAARAGHGEGGADGPAEVG